MKCPACGVVLELVLGTDYTKTQAILAAKASGSDLSNEELKAAAWKQSQKRPSLSTILVNDASLTIPIIKLLYDRLTTSASQSWKLGPITYKLSRTPEGTEFLQRWSPV
jgi:hypothetical protein